MFPLFLSCPYLICLLMFNRSVINNNGYKWETGFGVSSSGGLVEPEARSSCMFAYLWIGNPCLFFNICRESIINKILHKERHFSASQIVSRGDAEEKKSTQNTTICTKPPAEPRMWDVAQGMTCESAFDVPINPDDLLLWKQVERKPCLWGFMFLSTLFDYPP